MSVCVHLGGMTRQLIVKQISLSDESQLFGFLKIQMRRTLSITAVVLIAIVVTAFRLVLLAIGSALYLYLLPGIIATKREHPRANQIYLVCALTGWLIVPWLTTLGFAYKSSAAASVCNDLPTRLSELDERRQ